MPTKRDYYEILGLKKDASAAEIKSAYRKMALKFHPDKNKESDAEAKFKEINEAYQVLSDSKKKQTYDQFGHAAFDPASGMGGMGGNPFAGGHQQGPFTWSSSSGGGQDFDFGDPFDIFEQFFGGGFSRAQRKPRYTMRVSFMEAVKGVEKQVEIEGKKRKIKVPAGVSDGTRMSFDEFDITFDVASDPRYKRDGNDLFIDKKISFSTAALGGEVNVETPFSGNLKLKVRPGTQSHVLVRLRDEGVPRLRSRGKGDLYVRLIIEVPERLNREQKRVLEDLRDLD